MDWFYFIKCTWPIWAGLMAFFIHIEVKLAKIETNVKWLINNNEKKGGEK